MLAVASPSWACGAGADWLRNANGLDTGFEGEVACFSGEAGAANMFDACVECCKMFAKGFAVLAVSFVCCGAEKSGAEEGAGDCGCVCPMLKRDVVDAVAGGC